VEVVDMEGEGEIEEIQEVEVEVQEDVEEVLHVHVLEVNIVDEVLPGLQYVLVVLGDLKVLKHLLKGQQAPEILTVVVDLDPDPDPDPGLHVVPDHRHHSKTMVEEIRIELLKYHLIVFIQLFE